MDDVQSNRLAPSVRGLSFLYFLGWAVLLGARQWAFSASLFFSGMVCERVAMETGRQDSFGVGEIDPFQTRVQHWARHV